MWYCSVLSFSNFFFAFGFFHDARGFTIYFIFGQIKASVLPLALVLLEESSTPHISVIIKIFKNHIFFRPKNTQTLILSSFSPPHRLLHYYLPTNSSETQRTRATFPKNVLLIRTVFLFAFHILFACFTCFFISRIAQVKKTAIKRISIISSVANSIAWRINQSEKAVAILGQLIYFLSVRVFF